MNIANQSEQVAIEIINQSIAQNYNMGRVVAIENEIKQAFKGQRISAVNR